MVHSAVQPRKWSLSLLTGPTKTLASSARRRKRAVDPNPSRAPQSACFARKVNSGSPRASRVSLPLPSSK